MTATPDRTLQILVQLILVFSLSLVAEAQSLPEPQFLRRHEAIITALDLTRHRASFTVTPKDKKVKEPYLLSDYRIDPDHLTVLVKYGRGTPTAAPLADLQVGARIQLTASNTISGGAVVAEIILLRDRK